MRLVSSLGACLFLALTTGILGDGSLSSSPSSPSPPAPPLLSRHCQENAAAAAPGQEDPCGGAQVQFQGTYDKQIYCEPGLIFNTTQGTPPRLADCQALLRNATGMPGYWTASHWPGDSVASPMITNGTCQLTISKIGENLTQNATIGNGDIETFANLMMTLHNSTCAGTDKCSAWGMADCYSSPDVDVTITWEFIQPQP
ncbi:uncharacterized protein PG986_014617 [Apiospora aurea]|uniref:Ecp2 effector protein-like domain-containing protein n=1 Tax=Apiospora aurea TaxID=335848 RepID=A0ABR1PUG2_9PEZI